MVSHKTINSMHFPHIGGIEIGNRVWIGSNVSIEKGSLDNTIIKDDVLIDDLVQIGHNVIVGKRTQITAGCIWAKVSWLRLLVVSSNAFSRQ